VVLIDDAHWLDRESRDVLGFVARRLSGGSTGFSTASGTTCRRRLRRRSCAPCSTSADLYVPFVSF
jgi:hypothetical protein